MSFFSELKRRNVFRIATAYAIAAWLLLQIADLVLDNTSAPPWVIQSLFVIIGVGFVFALMFSWLYELTPEGVMKESEVPRERSITYHTAKKLDYLTIALLLGAVAYMVVDRYVLEAPIAANPTIAKDVPAGTPADAATTSSAGTLAGEMGPDTISQTPGNIRAESEEVKLYPAPLVPGEISIAVLPFVNMSADADNEYFSDGISEELMNVLVKVQSLRVASRTSAFSFKGKDTPIPEIARELKVNNILEGSVRKSGQRVRITAQLIDVSTDKHLWSETYDRELTDIFDIQAEISNAIVSALKVALKVEDQQAVSHAQQLTDNAEAYELYLRGRYLWRKRGEENLLDAVRLLEQAIALDPGFARAHEALASVWAVMTAWSEQPLAETMAKAALSAQRALELDPALSESHSILAEAAMGRHQFLEMKRHYETALENEPKNAQTREWYAQILTSLGFLQKGLQLNREAFDLDPTSPIINHGAAWASMFDEDHDRAYRHYEMVREMFVSQPFAPRVAEFLSHVGQAELDQYLDAYGDGIGRRYMDCIAKTSNADAAPSVEDQDHLTESLAGNPEAQALCLIRMGRLDEAIRLFEATISLDITEIVAFWWPGEHTARLRQSPRFREILNETGLSAFYLEYGLPDLCHRVGDNDFACN